MNRSSYQTAYMFSIFKKKDPLAKLQERHADLMEQAFKMSKSDRSAADRLYAQAEEVATEIDTLQKKASWTN